MVKEQYSIATYYTQLKFNTVDNSLLFLSILLCGTPWLTLTIDLTLTLALTPNP